MKKIITSLFMTAVMAAFSVGASAQVYALHFRSADAEALEPGATVSYAASEDDIESDLIALNIYIENLTEQAISTTHTIEQIEGPSGLLESMRVCAGLTCPWNGEPYNLDPGIGRDYPLTLDIPTANYMNTSSLLKITVKPAFQSLEGTVMYLRVTIGNVGIDDVAGEENAVTAWPNPTRGAVTVGNGEHQEHYDLSDRPAGVYALPYNGGWIKVVKL